MAKKIVFGIAGLVFFSLFLTSQVYSQEDPIAKVAMEALRTHVRGPKGIEIKFVEKKESPIPGFYSVKLVLLLPDREIPVIVYVDETAEKVILGNIFIKGENVTRKEAGEPKPRKIDMAQLEVEKSPFRGNASAKMTVVEFSNFQCPFCLRSWKKMKDLLERNPQNIKYVFKHFPLQPQGKAFEISEMVAATEALGKEAFWVIHDFFFSGEGQAYVNKEKAELKQKIEEILKTKGYDEKTFQAALQGGEGRKRIEEDMSLGRKFGVRATPTMIINGDFVGSTLTDKMLENYLK